MSASQSFFLDEDLLEVFDGEITEGAAYLEELAFEDRLSGPAIQETRRRIHSLKGSFGTIGLDAWGDLCHAIEDCLDTVPNAGTVRPEERFSQLMLQACDCIRSSLKSGDATKTQTLTNDIRTLVFYPIDEADSANPAETDASDPGITMRLTDLDQLQSQVERFILSSANSPGSMAEAASLRATLLQLRQTDFEKTGLKWRRLVQEYAAAGEKSVQLSLDGLKTRTDLLLVQACSDFIPHMLRNSLDHGIETPQERQETNKPETARIEIFIRSGASALSLEVRDDGRGMDSEVIYQKALQKGIVSESENLNHSEKLKLIFLPGFSTREEVSMTSGRGVGMDIVFNRLEELGGHIEIESTPYQGTIFDIRLPLTHQWDDYALFEIGSTCVGFPRRSVMRVVPANDCPLPQDGTLQIDEEMYPLIGFEEHDPDFGSAKPRDYVLLEIAGMPLAMAISAPLGHIKATPSPAFAGTLPRWFSGVATSPAGLFLCINLEALETGWNELMVPL